MYLDILDINDGLNSPFIVPVAGTVMILGIVAVSKWSEYGARKLHSEERMAAIAKGLPLPEPPAVPVGRTTVDLKQRIAKIRLGGIICVTGAIAVAVFFFILYLVIGQREILCGAAAALIPFGIGAGLLIDARINARDLESDPSQGGLAFKN
jgi:hypothetical protein